MDLIDKLTELATRAERQREDVQTEEAAKTAFVLPFLQALGYDIFNPLEVIPEHTADHGIKKGEKVDYALQINGEVSILIECKTVGASLEAAHASQLFRYFSVTDSSFGILTDGLRYLFFAALDKENKMDERPFLEFNLLQFGEREVEELKYFTKAGYDVDTILSTASNLKYHKAIKEELSIEFTDPSEEFVRMLVSRVYSGRFTQQVKEQFTPLVQNAFKDFVRNKVNDRLKSALETESKPSTDIGSIEKTELLDSDVSVNDGIVTTQEELDAFAVLRAIGSEVVDPERIAMRDSKSYCAILLDDNNRRTITRLYFGKRKMRVGIFASNGEVKFDIERVPQIYQHRTAIIDAIQQYQDY